MLKDIFFLIMVSLISIPIKAEIVELDTIYYDKDWKGINGSHFATYYRIIEKNPNPNYKKLCRDYYITGEIQGEGEYITIDPSDDSKTLWKGEVTNYYKNGNVAEVKHFNDQGLLHGNVIEYSENGKISMKNNYNNGSLDGEQIVFFENGNIAAKANMKNGVQNGELIKYYPNGNISEKGNVVAGILEGQYLKFYEDGKPQLEAFYIHNQPEGIYKEYTEEGLCFQQEFKNGEAIGDYFLLKSPDGWHSRIRKSDNSIIYNSPDPSEMKNLGKNSYIYLNDGVNVIINLREVSDYGKYYRIDLTIDNKSFQPMKFNPQNIKAYVVNKKGQETVAEVQTASDYRGRINRTLTAEEGLSAYAQKLEAQNKAYSVSKGAAVSSDGTVSVGTSVTYDANAAVAAEQVANQNIANLKQKNSNMVNSKLSNYVQSITIDSGEKYDAYFNIKKKKGEIIRININVGGAIYQFECPVKP